MPDQNVGITWPESVCMRSFFLRGLGSALDMQGSRAPDPSPSPGKDAFSGNVKGCLSASMRFRPQRIAP